MVDTRQKLVWDEVIDTVSRSVYLNDMLSERVTPATKYMDSIDLPYYGSTFTYADVVDGSNVVQTLTPDAGGLVSIPMLVNQKKGTFVSIVKEAEAQTMQGGYFNSLVQQASGQSLNRADENVAQYNAYEGAWDTTGTYHTNAAGATITSGMLLDTVAKVLSNDGIMRSDLFWMFHPYGQANVENLVGFAADFGGLRIGELGVTAFGKVHGIPAYTSNSIPRAHSVATTVAVVSGTGTVLTLTVAAGHGIVPGTVGATTLMTQNFATATVTSVTSTSIVATISGGADATLVDGIGLFSETTAWNMLFCKSRAFVGKQKWLSSRIVPVYNQDADILQITSYFGRKTFQYGAGVVHTKGSTVS